MGHLLSWGQRGPHYILAGHSLGGGRQRPLCQREEKRATVCPSREEVREAESAQVWEPKCECVGGGVQGTPWQRGSVDSGQGQAAK